MAKQQVCGFRIRLKLVKSIKCAVHAKLTRPGYGKIKAITRFCKFGQSLKRSMKKLCFRRSGSNYVRLGQDNSCDEKPVPRGHLAVYFGEKEDDARRVLVPVIYFNHPLFGDLLRQAEKVYGFDHRGSIHVPCRISEFESVQSRICAAGGCGSSWRRWL